MLRSSLLGMTALLLLAVPATVTRAADLYVSGRVLNSFATGESAGATDFFALTGDDTDTSPGYGGALGFGFGLNEAIPSLGNLETPGVELRVEVEGLFGREYEFRTEGGDGFFNEVDSWSLMYNVWLDLPVGEPVSWIFGRIPVLEPLSLYGGGGVGVTSIDFKTTDNFSFGEDSTLNTAYQFGGGISYDLTRAVTIGVGYRYHAMGEVEAPLSFSPGSIVGTQELSLDSHEFNTALRINFYSRHLDEFVPKRWKLPRPDLSLPRWMVPRRWRRR